MHSDKDSKTPDTLTIVLPGGRLPLDILGKIGDLGRKYGFELYLSTAQNLRLYNIAPERFEELKGEVAALGVRLRRPGTFPVPRICVGEQSCKLGLIDTMALSDRVLEHFRELTGVKPKLKVAISGCPAACSNAMLTDIGIVATRSGFDLYLGGKGGPRPKAGRRVAKGITEEEVLKIIGEAIEFHNAHTAKKQRFWKHLDEPDFPYGDEV